MRGVAADGRAGAIGIPTPPELGGNEIDLVSMGIATEEIARGDFSATYGIQLAGLAGQILGRSASEEVKTRWLPPTARGETIVALALTEPGVGSDAANLACRAVQDRDGYLLTGRSPASAWAWWRRRPSEHGFILDRLYACIAPTRTRRLRWPSSSTGSAPSRARPSAPRQEGADGRAVGRGAPEPGARCGQGVTPTGSTGRPPSECRSRSPRSRSSCAVTTGEDVSPARRAGDRTVSLPQARAPR